ncbi:hypothetical protein E4U43_001208 [Claviceps pusilla]|uniref:Transcription factor spt8 beta-propeller domain-containing protein n=1 Tax=Claviceps pusilla TaxID=123648 RepID=A0A9P7SZC7_9HYPO|nr:hypothetical protein E4U43_001208 [Claviceps pusilla]
MDIYEASEAVVMDDEDRFSASSPESDRHNEPDEVMDDGDEGENDAEHDDDHNEEDDDNNDDDEDGNDGEDGGDESQNIMAHEPGLRSDVKPSSPNTPGLAAHKPYLRPSIRPEAITARLYDIVPTMAAPQSTSINAMAITPDLRYWITGGSDGYIRKYDGPGTINGKLPLTVAQKHPFVDSVTKAGILMSYWENEEPSAPGRGDHDHNLSPVYSLAVHSEALWLLSGLESGGINLQSVRHDEGKKIACLQQHKNAVSSLMLAPDERSVLSGGWDKNIYDWDLNTGHTIRSFDGSGGQISSIELRPASGDPVPAEADEPIQSTTISTNNGAPLPNGVFHDEPIAGNALGADSFVASEREGDASPAHESLFGGSDAGSLFGETAGEQPFGNDDDGFGASLDMMPGHEGGMDHSADFAMADMQEDKEKADDEGAPSSQTMQTQQSSQAQDAMSLDRDSKPTAAEASDDASLLVDSAADEPHAEAQPTPEADNTLQQLADDPCRDDDEKIMAQLAEDKKAMDRSRSRSRSRSPGMTVAQHPLQHVDQSQMSTSTFLSSAIDGTIRLWDRRVPNAVARIGTRQGVPPWCMSACWSPDGNMIYAGRRNGTVEEYDVRKARRGWEPERALRFPTGSGAVSAVKSMPNGRHLVW